MVNFGYGPGMKYWNEENKTKLASALDYLITNMQAEGTLKFQENIQCGTIDPFIEVDELYKGVRIRHITHLTDESMQHLVENAEDVYRKVMVPSASS